MSQNGANGISFITEVANQQEDEYIINSRTGKKLHKSNLLENIRKEYSKLRDVVQLFHEKVGLMVDKQVSKLLTSLYYLI